MAWDETWGDTREKENARETALVFSALEVSHAVAEGFPTFSCSAGKFQELW